MDHFDAPRLPNRLFAPIFNSGVISIVQATGVVAGPTGSSDSQWAKCGTSPQNAVVIGCIITPAFATAFYLSFPKDSTSFGIPIRQCMEIMRQPSYYFGDSQKAFMQRYVAAGCFGAYGDWLASRCIWYSADVEDVDPRTSSPTETVLKHCVSDYLRDDSYEEQTLLRDALTRWLTIGMPPSNKPLYHDPLNGELYSQRDLKGASQNTKERLEVSNTEEYEAYLKVLEELVLAQFHVRPAIRQRTSLGPPVSRAHLNLSREREGVWATASEPSTWPEYATGPPGPSTAPSRSSGSSGPLRLAPPNYPPSMPAMPSGPPIPPDAADASGYIWDPPHEAWLDSFGVDDKAKQAFFRLDEWYRSAIRSEGGLGPSGNRSDGSRADNTEETLHMVVDKLTSIEQLDVGMGGDDRDHSGGTMDESAGDSGDKAAGSGADGPPVPSKLLIQRPCAWCGEYEATMNDACCGWCPIHVSGSDLPANPISTV